MIVSVLLTVLSLWHDNLRINSLDKMLIDKYGLGYQDCPKLDSFRDNETALRNLDRIYDRMNIC